MLTITMSRSTVSSIQLYVHVTQAGDSWMSNFVCCRRNVRKPEHTAKIHATSCFIAGTRFSSLCSTLEEAAPLDELGSTSFRAISDKADGL